MAALLTSTDVINRIKDVPEIVSYIQQVRTTGKLTLDTAEEIMRKLYYYSHKVEADLVRQWIQERRACPYVFREKVVVLAPSIQLHTFLSAYNFKLRYVPYNRGYEMDVTEGECRYIMYLFVKHEIDFVDRSSYEPFTKSQAEQFEQRRYALVFDKKTNHYVLRTHENKGVPKTLGMSWDSVRRVWYAEPHEIDWDNSLIQSVISSDCYSELELRKQQMLRRLAVAESARVDQLTPTLDGFQDKPYQTDALKFLLSALTTGRGAILQYEMGLGKTRIGCQFARLYRSVLRDTVVVVVCPAAVVNQWYRTARGFPLPNMFVYSWSNIPTTCKHKQFILLVDESHKTQNMRTKQAQNVLRLAALADFTVCLTGTASPNGRPKELIGQLKMCGVSETYNERSFIEKYHTSYTVAPLIEQYCLTLKVQDVYGQDKPNINYIQHILTIEQQRALDEVFNGVLERFYDKVDAGEASIFGKSFVTLTASRVANSVAKIDTTIMRVHEICDSSPVVIFTDFAVSANQLYTRLTGVRHDEEFPEEETNALVLGGSHSNPGEFALVLGGSDKRIDPTRVTYYSSDLNASQRDKAVTEFTSGKTDVFIATYGTGGTGIDGLQNRKPIVLLHDLSWVPGIVDQAIYRVHRMKKDGTLHVATVEAVLGHAIDKVVYEKLVEKRHDIRDMGI